MNWKNKRRYNAITIIIFEFVIISLIFNIGYLFSEVGLALFVYTSLLVITILFFINFDFNKKILPLLFCIYRLMFILFLILFLNKNNLSSLSLELVGNDEIPWIALFIVDIPSFVLNLIIWGLISSIIPASIYFNMVILPSIIFMTIGSVFYYLTMKFLVLMQKATYKLN